MRKTTFALALVALYSLSGPARAEVVRVEITSRTDVENGAAFGNAGAYEVLSGRIHFAVDPRDARNAVIVDLENAPPSAGGKVELSADLSILQPKVAAKGNGTLLLDVANRGRRTVLTGFNRAEGSGYGDGLLLREGFTVAWVGWEFDVPQRDGALRVQVPLAEGATTTVRSLATPNAATPTFTFDDLWPYAPVDANAAANALTVRDGPFGPATNIDRAGWTLDGNTVALTGGFEAGRMYELSFESANPPVAGLGFAAVRDAAAWLRHATDTPARVQRAIAFGSSQSGRFLRTFLYLGFNQDEQGRQVFDGVMAHIAGASRLDLNRRGATPTSLGQFDATSFPFADAALRDPVTGVEEGALANARAKGFEPKIFYTNTGVEYWGGGRSAALVHSTPDGVQDLALPANERVYFLAGSQHGPTRFPPASPALGAQRENPTDYWLVMRALLVAMNDWVTSGKTPPPSRYPTLADRTLVRAAEVAFPDIPGVRSPRALPIPTRGKNPLIVKDGAPGAALPYLVPQTDRDGTELAGIRLPEIAVPLATYTGWNYRNPAIGGADNLYPLLGSYVPFAATRSARAPKDLRAAITERYPSEQAFLDAVREAGERLIGERYLLAEDLPRVMDRATRHWELLAK